MPPRNLTARYIELANELGAEMNHARGWRRRVASQLGIDESTLSRILKGNREVGWDLAERAIERLKLDPAYFTAPQKKAGSMARGAARQTTDQSGPVRKILEKFESGSAGRRDVFALACAVVDSPAVRSAREILKMRAPKSEQGVGELFIVASQLIEELRAQAKEILKKP